MLTLRTPRLLLRAATPGLVRAELAGRQDFARALGADVPAAWPPPLNDEASMRWILGILESDPATAGWSAWYFLLCGSGGALTAVGNGGFKGRPDAAGTVEIGYSILDAHQRHGLAPEAVGSLVTWAFSHAEVTRVIAHTLPGARPSMRVLEKCGFSFVGPGLEEGAFLFERWKVGAGA